MEDENEVQPFRENASGEDIQERINFVVGVHKGLRELGEGKGISHDEVRNESADFAD